MTTNPSNLVPGAEPLSVEGGDTGVLLIHGFTGSPASMTPWGRSLANKGFSVRVPRLPGHGTTWQEMNATGWEDWYGEVDNALTELRTTCDRVAIGGLSMGGCLALRLAEQRPEDVDALVLVNPAVNLKRKALLAVPALAHVLPAMPGIGNDIKKPGIDEIGYDKTPLKALASQLKLWKDTRANLSKVTAPLLFFRSDVDHVVDETTKAIVFAGVSSSVKEFVPLHDSYHVATIDNDAPLIYELTEKFIAEHLEAGNG